MRPNDIYTVDDLVDNLRECAKDWLYCGGSEALEEQFELASEAIRERVTDFEAKVIALQKELDELKERYRWHNIEVDGLPELEREVIVITARGDVCYGLFSEKKIGKYNMTKFRDALRGLRFTMKAAEVNKWRYLNAPKEGE